MLQFFTDFIDLICLFIALCVCCCFDLICIIPFLNYAFSVCIFCCCVFVCIISFFSSTLSLIMICVIPCSLSRCFCRWFNLFSLSGTVSIFWLRLRFVVIWWLLLRFVLPGSVCLFLFVTVVSFLLLFYFLLIINSFHLHLVFFCMFILFF